MDSLDTSCGFCLFSSPAKKDSKNRILCSCVSASLHFSSPVTRVPVPRGFLKGRGGFFVQVFSGCDLHMLDVGRWQDFQKSISRGGETL